MAADDDDFAPPDYSGQTKPRKWPALPSIDLPSLPSFEIPQFTLNIPLPQIPDLPALPQINTDFTSMPPRIASVHSVHFDRERGLGFTPQDEESADWFNTMDVASEVAVCLDDVIRSNPKMTRDPLPDECPPPAGTVTPTIVAAALQRHLRARFPNETIYIWNRNYNVMPR